MSDTLGTAEPLRLAVIIPTYNRAARVRQTVETLLASGVPLHEVLVVDDGGSDDTEAHLAGTPGVRYVRQANAGPARARNTGAAAATADVLCFLDDDDSWPDASMARLLTQLGGAPDIAAVFADTSMGNEVDGFVSFIETYSGDALQRLPHHTSPDGLVRHDFEPFFRQLARRNLMFLGSLLVRRDTFLQIGGFDEGLRGAADWEFFMRLALQASVAFSPGSAPSLYIKHDQGMSTDSDHMDRDFILALDRIAANPHLPAALRPYIREQLQRHMFGFAYQAYDRQDYATARRRFLDAARRYGPLGRNLAYAALASCPAPVVAFVRGARQRRHV